MKFFEGSMSNNSSKDAKCFAPYTCERKDKVNIFGYTDIALAMSVLFCITAIITIGISAIGFIIISIIFLSIILICGDKFFEKAVN